MGGGLRVSSLLFVLSRAFTCFRISRLFSSEFCCSVLAGRVGGGSGCCLRTAQWTRASLWLSF